LQADIVVIALGLKSQIEDVKNLLATCITLMLWETAWNQAD